MVPTMLGLGALFKICSSFAEAAAADSADAASAAATEAAYSSAYSWIVLQVLVSGFGVVFSYGELAVIALEAFGATASVVTGSEIMMLRAQRLEERNRICESCVHISLVVPYASLSCPGVHKM